MERYQYRVPTGYTGHTIAEHKGEDRQYSTESTNPGAVMMYIECIAGYAQSENVFRNPASG